MADNILETLIVELKANMQPLETGLGQAARESQQAGVRIGQGLQAGIDRTNLKDDGVKLGRELTTGLEQGIKQGGAGVERAVTGLTASLGSKSGGGLGGAFASLTAGAGGLTAGLGGVVGALGPVGAAVTSVAGAVTAAVTVFNNATNEFAKFEKGLAGVSTLTEQMPGQLGQTGQAILNLSRDLGMSYQDLTSGLQDILGAGVRGTESMTSSLAFLKDAAKLAIAGQTDTAVATDALTTVLNSYKLSAADTKAVSDGLFRTVQDGKISFNVLAGSIGNVTNIAAESGVSLQELNAAIATMTANGIQGSTSIDYLRSAITAIIKPSDEAQKLADKLGVQFDAQALKSKGLTGVLRDVQAATKGNTEQMAILFGGVEAMSAATAIASGNFDRMTTNLKNQAEAAGTTETAYTKMAGTLSKQNDKVDASWKTLMINLGNAFAPFKTEVLSGITVMLDGLNKVVEKFNLARNIKNSDAEITKQEAIIASNARERADLVRRQGPAAGTVVYERLQAKIDALDASTKAAQARLTQLQAEAAQARADQTAYNVASSSAMLPKGVQGPNMGGSGGAVTPVQVVTGRDLVTLLGMGGRTVLNEYGVSGANYHHDGAVSANATHNGIDYAAQRGSAILAPFTGELSVREDAKNGKIFELVDQAGNKIVGIHLDSFDKAVLAALNAGGGKAIIGQGTRIGGVGNTGTTAGSAPHLHLMGYAAGNSRPVDPTGIKFQGMGSAEYGVDGSKPYPSATSGGSTSTDTDDKAAKNRAAIQKEIDASVAKGKVDAAQRALAELKRLQAEELDAAKDNAAKRAQIVAQTGPQIIAAEARIARAVRDQAVQSAGQWAKEQMAKEGADAKAIEAERVRRVRDAYAVEAQAKKQAQSDQARAVSSAQDAADKDAERRDKEAQARAARINEAIRQGKIEAARNELTRLQEMRTNDLRSAGENAQKVAQVEQRYATLTYNAKAAIALKERQDRDADIRNNPDLNATGRAQALKNSEQAYLTALKAAGNERNAALDRIGKDAEAIAAKNAATMPGLMSGWIDNWAQDQEKDRAAAAAGAAVVDKLFAGAIDQLSKSRAEMEAALTDALSEIYQKAIDAGIDPFAGGSPDQFRDMSTPGRSGLAALIGGNPAGFLSAYTATGGTPDALLKEFADADWESLGLDVLQGLADGMRSDTAWDAVRGVVEGALGRILADSAFAADVAALVSDRNGMLGAPAGIVTGNERPDGERTSLAETVGKKTALDAYAESLKTLDTDQLAVAESAAIAADNTDFYNAIAAERARRLQEQKDKAEAAAKAERELAEAVAKKQADAIAQAVKDTEDYNAAQDALAKSTRELGAAMGEVQMPYQSQIEALEDLKVKMPSLGAEIDALIARWKELQAATIKKNELEQLAQGFQKLSNAISGVFKSFGADGAGQVVDGLGQIGDAALKLPGAFKDAQSAWSTFKSGFSLSSLGGLMGAVGGVVNIVGAAINGIMAIGNAIEDMSSSLQAWKKGLREVAEEQKKVLGMSSGGFKSPWADALAKDAANRDQLANSRWYQRLWWGLTGGGPQAISDEAAKLLTELQGIFAQLGDGIASAFTDAMLDVFNSGDMGNFAENFSKSFDQVVGKVVLKTMIDAAITQGAVAGDLAELTKAIQEQRYGDIPAIMTKIKADAGVVAGQLGAVLPSIPGFGAGADGSSGADGQGGVLFGATPGASLGLARVEVTLPDIALKGFDTFGVAAPVFLEGSQTLLRAAQLIEQAFGRSGPPAVTGYTGLAY